MPQHSHTTYDPVHDEVYPARVNLQERMHDEDKTCDKCAHWAYARKAPVAARVNGALVCVAQCLHAGQDDAAPYADMAGAEAAIFTQANSRCNAFALHPDIIHDEDAFGDCRLL